MSMNSTNGSIKFECIVVGAGIEGSATAYALQKAGKQTLLLEKFPLPHTRGSSHGASRIIRKAYPANVPVYTQMMQHAYPMWQQLAQNTQMKLITTTGLLWLGLKEKGEVRATYEHLKSLHIPADLLTSDQVHARYPQLNYDADYEALFDHTAGVMHAQACLAAFQNEFRRLGGVLRDGEPVTSVRPGQQVLVRTNNNKYICDSLVLCLGPWAPTFLHEQLHLRLPMQPQVIKVCYWKDRTQSHSLGSGFPVMICESKNQDHFYGLPHGEYPGMFKFCMHVGHEAHPDQRDVPPVTMSQLQIEKAAAHVQQFFADIEPRPSIVETCYYTVTPDENPFLDRHPRFDNIVIGAGFSGHGFKLAPIVGDTLSKLVLGQKPLHDMSLFCIPEKYFIRQSSKI